MCEINVSRTGDPVHAGDKTLTRETPAKRGRVNRYANNILIMFINELKNSKSFNNKRCSTTGVLYIKIYIYIYKLCLV